MRSAGYFIGFFFFALNGQHLFSQSILIDPPNSIYSKLDLPNLVNGLLSSDCRTVIHESTLLSGDNKSYGYFEKGSTSFPFEKGILLTTGTAINQVGPNLNLEQTSSPSSGTGQYAVINEILDNRMGNSVSTQNHISTKFWVVPQTDKFSIRYIFASESYGNVNNIECFNGMNELQDGFAILIKGPGILPDTFDHDNDTSTPEIEFSHGSKNIALLPDGITEVGLHSIHDNLTCSNLGFSDYYKEIPLGYGSIASNGMTIPLIAEANVIPGEEYLVEIVLANRGDNTLDSSLYIDIDKSYNEPKLLNQYFICSDETGRYISPFPIIDTEIAELDYRFNWYYNDTILNSENSSFIVANQSGDYTVEVINPSGCSKFYSTKVESSSAPFEFTYNLEGNIFSNDQNLTIHVQGFGDYLFQLDDGIPQQSNSFGNISPGFYELKVTDINGCGNRTSDIVVVDYPKFFTPNNDGLNDLWNINFDALGVNGRIKIYDRYGKFLKILDSKSAGWDGIYNGKILPSSDYWFELLLDNGQSFKNHFTLKR